MSKHPLRNHAAALLLLLPAAATLAATPATARVARVAPVIQDVTVSADSGLAPGSTLALGLQATPGARRALLVLGDSGVRVHLRERAPGHYEGRYVVRRADRIDPRQNVVARIDVHGQVVERPFAFPVALQSASMGAPAAAGPEIDRFVMRPLEGGRIEPGRELRFRLVGAPGGDAWLDIPGVIRGVDLQEIRPGVYEGRYTVRRRDDLRAFDRAVATLRAGGQQATARVVVRGEEEWGPGGGGRGGDRTAPAITDLTPANDERVDDRGRTHIAARFADTGSGVDERSVRLMVDGRDVTRDARVESDGIRYRDDLRPGRHAVELTLRDRAGNESRQAWSFDVGGDARHGQAGPRELPLRITNLADNAVFDANQPMTLRGRTVPFANVRVRIESIANVAGVLGVTQPVADQTVQADREGEFVVHVEPRGALPIPSSRYDVRVTATAGSQTAEEHLTLRGRG